MAGLGWCNLPDMLSSTAVAFARRPVTQEPMLDITFMPLSVTNTESAMIFPYPHRQRQLTNSSAHHPKRRHSPSNKQNRFAILPSLRNFLAQFIELLSLFRWQGFNGRLDVFLWRLVSFHLGDFAQGFVGAGVAGLLLVVLRLDFILVAGDVVA